MRDQHEGERIIGQILLQPVAGFQIQVIGRLVQQQQVRLFEQQFGQRDAHLPAAGEFLGAALPIGMREPEPGQHRSHLRLDGVAVARAKLAVQLMKTVGHLRVFGAGRIELRHLVRQLLHLLFHVCSDGEDRHAFGEHACGRRATGRPAAGSRR